MKKRHDAEKIATKLRQAEVDLGKGITMAKVCKKSGIIQKTCYHWRPPSCVTVYP